MGKLTKRVVDALEPQQKDYVVWDDELKGFGVRVKPSGRKSFVIQYYNAQRRSRRMTIGLFGRLTPEEARKAARLALSDADRGRDPLEEKNTEKDLVTISVLADRYMAEHAEVKKKQSSINRDRRLLDRFVRPVLGSKPVANVKREDIAKFHHSLRQTPTQANRVLALLSKMFSLAERWGLRTDGSNPCRHVERYKEKKRERYLSIEELARLGKALDKAETEGSEDLSGITAIRLLIYTGCRREEILSLKWEHVNFELNCLQLPDSKTGAKLVPLGDAAVELLKRAHRVAGNPYVCPGRKWASHLVGLPRIWARICENAGLKEVRLHDLRHSFASVGAGAGLGLPMIGALLGHTQAATTQRYAHLAIAPLQDAANLITQHIAEAMSKPVDEKVVDLKK